MWRLFRIPFLEFGQLSRRSVFLWRLLPQNFCGASFSHVGKLRASTWKPTPEGPNWRFRHLHASFRKASFRKLGALSGVVLLRLHLRNGTAVTHLSRKSVRRRFLNIRTSKQPNRYILLPPQSMASGRPQSKTSGMESKEENIRISIDLLYYLRGTLGLAALHLFEKCHRTHLASSFTKLSRVL